MYFHEQQGWLIEHCLICGSVNHLFLHNQEVHAWECWACFTKWWIDEFAKDSIMMACSVDSEEADDMLIKCDPAIIFVFGHAERDTDD